MWVWLTPFAKLAPSYPRSMYHPFASPPPSQVLFRTGLVPTPMHAQHSWEPEKSSSRTLQLCVPEFQPVVANAKRLPVGSMFRCRTRSSDRLPGRGTYRQSATGITISSASKFDSIGSATYRHATTGCALALSYQSARELEIRRLLRQ